MNRIFITAAVLALAIATPSSQASLIPPAGTNSLTKEKIFRVVIDPGHGGVDMGTVYQDRLTLVAEKDVTLALGHEVARQLRARGITAVLTRRGDRDLSLPQRTAMANQLEADVFISIHMNSNPSQHGHAEGVETYILNNASDASSHRLAMLENAVLGPEALNSPTQSDVALILKDLRLDANLGESKRLACAVQGQLAGSNTKRDRGVKQALFYVLLGADMPSVLVEAGFLSSQKDRSLVLSPSGRNRIGVAIARAVSEFKRLKNAPKSSSALASCKVN